MKYALIGCGRIAKFHIKAALAQDELQISAVCDILPERMDAMLAIMPEQTRTSVKKFTDYKEMLSEVSPDLVAIATESGKHAAIALDCISAGANVIIEKPIAMSVSDADEIIDRGREKGVKIAVCHQNRFNVAVSHIRRALEQGRFGKLSHGCVHVRWNRNEDYYKQAPWRGTMAQDGGVLMNQSTHSIDILLWMMGDVEEIHAITSNRFHPYIECEDVGVAVLRFSSGALGTIEGTANVYPENLEETLYIFGEKGSVKAGGKSLNTIEIWQFEDEEPEDTRIRKVHEEAENIYGNGHNPLYADMVDSIINNRQPYIDGVEGKKAMEIVLRIYRKDEH